MGCIYCKMADCGSGQMKRLMTVQVDYFQKWTMKAAQMLGWVAQLIDDQNGTQQ